LAPRRFESFSGFDMRIVLATNNQSKLNELSALLHSWSVQVLPLSAFTTQSPAETGLSFIENAILKARFAAQASGLPAVADDSGLEVDALQGAPGIYSARYAGAGASDEENLRKLLSDLSNINATVRTARYQCALAYMRDPHDPSPLVCQSSWRGSIRLRAEGSGGFGYDPIFEIEGLALTAAQLPPQEKNRISHRGQALQCLMKLLQSEGALLPRPS
jgi:XTP/dITP diphosphohydrolase